MINSKQKGSGLIIAMIIVVVLSIIAVTGWMYLPKRKENQNNTSQLYLTNVIYQSQNPSLPPQYSKAKSASYADKAQLEQIDSLLKAYSISLIEEKNPNGCTGGTNYQYDLTYSDKSTIKYKTYKCANSFYGNMGGDVAGFVSSFEKELKP